MQRIRRALGFNQEYYNNFKIYENKTDFGRIGVDL